MNTNEKQGLLHQNSDYLTKYILLGMLFGTLLGLCIKYTPFALLDTVEILLSLGGKAFILMINMLVIPVVFISIVCGISHLADPKKIGRIAGKAFLFYIATTIIAIILGLTIAELLNIGGNTTFTPHQTYDTPPPPTMLDVIYKLFPSNPIQAMAKGELLQVIVFALFFGSAIALSGAAGARVATLFDDLNEIVMTLVMIILKIAPIGVFCLIGSLFARTGFEIIFDLASYFFTTVLALMLHLLITYSLFLKLFASLNPIFFFKNMFSVMLFALSTASSNATMPIALNTVKKQLGVHNRIASFVIPIGATINMDGTAIMQAIATVFIAHTYGIELGLAGYLTVILTAALASIGTAGIPSIGIITLVMVLQQLGLPGEGIALIIGIDRLIDMVRTMVNTTGDAVIACLVAKSEKALETAIWQK